MSYGLKKRQIPKNLSHRAQDETRTHTILRPLPPQSSVYTNFTTCARRNSLATRFVAYTTKLSPRLLLFKKALLAQCFFEVYKDHFVVPRTGLEPARLATYAPETYASTNSATWAERSANRAIGCRLRDIKRTIASAPSKNNFASSFSSVTKSTFGEPQVLFRGFTMSILQ